MLAHEICSIIQFGSCVLAESEHQQREEFVMRSKFVLASVVSLTLAGIAPMVMAADRNDSRIDARDESRIPYSQVPGEVRRAIEPQLNSGDKVTDVYKYKRGDRTVYVATTNDERV